MDRVRGRTAGAVVTAGDECLGTFGPFALDIPWWAEAESVVAHLTAALGVPVMVLRLIGVDGGEGARDGHVTYHVEAFERPRGGLLGPPPSDHGDLFRPAARRAGWATAAGLREALEWARASLGAADRPVTGAVRQIKTWNLAGLFRIPTSAGPAWLKTTPEFATPEASAIGLVAGVDPGIVPGVVAAEPGRGWTLLEHVPGEDCWDASPEVIRTVIGRWVAAQAALAVHVETARTAPAEHPGATRTAPAGHPAGVPEGLPDRRLPVLAGRVRGLLDGEAAAGLTGDELSAAWRLADALPARISAIEECGLPDTLVHADFHSGNWRSGGLRSAVVDFADSHIGHPVLDGLRVRDFRPGPHRTEREQAWISAWSARVPGSDPVRALALAEPLAHLMYAVRYQEFLDGIETSERIYHEGDPAVEIRAALESAHLA
ncbi:hypothetical protein GCM10010156_41460 [Planobispora rosea]|uniref:Aminoglycoside phosphotransferase domain-containing protein n=1 Tax=Planobispora rosea TaxID=35762 RepID=A0A8J3WDS9_PLARO|nr:aminoglycoside phosphotransferase family protein [Planobispora rosea]GGS78458.1 hypothetical protein GCM10010156_41460 [Planobispora rosea]GIH85670.1 hypothetical protein Pro02_40780 [Planobispora rosea]